MYPLYYQNAHSNRIEVTVHAGQMLYIPAGWFHEVFSSNDGSDEGHCAFNYWFHPPDNLEAKGELGVKQPYKSTFWAEDMTRRLKQK